jgi:large repetitive protein
VTLTLDKAPGAGVTVTVTYHRPESDALEDAAGNPARHFRVAVTLARSSQSIATLLDRTLTLTFSEALSESSIPDRSAFPLTVDDQHVELAEEPVMVSGGTVVLTLASAPEAGARVTVGYVPPDTGALMYATGEPVDDFAVPRPPP